LLLELLQPLLFLLSYLPLLLHSTHSSISIPRSTVRGRWWPRRWWWVERHIGRRRGRHTHLLPQRPHHLGAHLFGDSSDQIGRQLVGGGTGVEGMAHCGCGGGDR
jgi:hypothetical protein